MEVGNPETNVARSTNGVLRRWDRNRPASLGRAYVIPNLYPLSLACVRSGRHTRITSAASGSSALPPSFRCRAIRFKLFVSLLERTHSPRGPFMNLVEF